MTSFRLWLWYWTSNCTRRTQIFYAHIIRALVDQIAISKTIVLARFVPVEPWSMYLQSRFALASLKHIKKRCQISILVSYGGRKMTPLCKIASLRLTRSYSPHHTPLWRPTLKLVTSSRECFRHISSAPSLPSSMFAAHTSKLAMYRTCVHLFS